MLGLGLRPSFLVTSGSSAPVVVYERTAFVSNTGNDGTGTLNDPDLPYLTVAAAMAALDALYPAEGKTLRFKTNHTDSVTLADNYYSLVGHGAVRSIGGVSGDGAGATGSGTGANGEPGKSVTLDAVDTSVTVTGGPGDSGSFNTLPGGNGAKGGTITARNGAILSINQNGGAGGDGGGGDPTGMNGGNGGDGGDYDFDDTCTISSHQTNGGNFGLGGFGSGSNGTNGIAGVSGTDLSP